MKNGIKVWRIAIMVLVVLLIAGGIAWQQGLFEPLLAKGPGNAIMIIAPYKYAGTWVIDDEKVGLSKEPFVSGIPELIDEMVKDIPDAEKGFRLLFSTQPFPEYSHKLEWRRGDKSGNWYYTPQYDKEGWLCPALFKYYKEAPKEIYIKAEKI